MSQSSQEAFHIQLAPSQSKSATDVLTNLFLPVKLYVFIRGSWAHPTYCESTHFWGRKLQDDDDDDDDDDDNSKLPVFSHSGEQKGLSTLCAFFAFSFFQCISLSREQCLHHSVINFHVIDS